MMSKVVLIGSGLFSEVNEKCIHVPQHNMGQRHSKFTLLKMYFAQRGWFLWS